ncbi:MAG: hypothetical protein IH608_05785 [Proteobacteria bacterium]|nr:hypothetical protein [Pseudomonadota bacterium]
MLTAAAAPCCRSPQPTLRESTALRELSLNSTETLDLSFTDEAGRAYQLTVVREESLYALTYDRQAQLALPGRNGRGLARGRHKGEGMDAGSLQQALRDSDLTVAGFQKLLHRFLKTVDSGYGERFRSFDPVAARAQAVEQEHAEFLAVNQTVTVTLTMPEDIPADYWSVESTAGRLRDFAVSLYGGGNRGEHRDAMVRGMEQGYREAQAAFGGALPDIARQTVDLAKDLLADWAEGESGAQPTVLDLVA